MKSLFLKFCFLFALFILPAFASAGTEHNMAGYAWSSNIGWVSFNCTNTNSCGTINYGVHKASDGRLCGNESCSAIGYAWSSNIGWIQFGGLSGFPAGAGTYAQNAQLVGTSLRGWARALSYSGSWDGWISLTGSTYGVTLPSTSFAGYAWGSDVIGWLSFDAAGATNGVKVSGDANVGISGFGEGGTVPYGTVPTFEWTITNVSGSCSVTKIAGGSPFSTPIQNKTVSGSQVEDALTVAGLHTYSIDCTNPSLSKQYNITVAAQIPGFTLGPDENVRIQILPTGTADSEQKTIFVEPNAAFIAAANPVTVTITSYPAPIASTTFMYSFDGGANYYSQGSGSLVRVINAPYNAGVGLKVRITRLAGAPDLTGPYTIRFTGTSAGSPSDTKDAFINLVPFSPEYTEF